MKAAVLAFVALGLACAAACALAGSARLLGPFVASIGVVCAAPSGALRRHAGDTAWLAHVACGLLGWAVHALLPATPAVALVAALGGFVALRAWHRPHAPALALLVVIALNGASPTDLAGALAMASSLWLGGRLYGRAAAAV